MLPVSLTLVEHQCSPCSYDIHSLYSTPSWMNGKIHGLLGAAPVVVKHFDSVRNFRVEFMFISQDHFGFLQVFCCIGAQKHDRNFLLLQRFQPMTAQLSNVDCHAVRSFITGASITS